MSKHWVSRCQKCHGVTHEKGTLLWKCPKCGAQDSYGLVDIAIAPPDSTPRALDAPIMVDRFYENTAATDGTDIGSRRKHREYMRRHGLTTADDYKTTWDRRAVERERVKQGELPSKTRREALERALYKIDKP